MDPVTGRQVYLRETIQGTDAAAWKKADDKLAQFRAQMLKQRSVASSVPLGNALDEWLAKADLEDSTRDGYAGYIERVIKPALGKTPVRKIGARELESLYAELRRCRVRCDRRPFIEKHKGDGEHDCVEAKCVPHKCKPMADPSPSPPPDLHPNTVRYRIRKMNKITNLHLPSAKVEGSAQRHCSHPRNDIDSPST
ncbi:MAG: hypothetical protein GEU86_15880 [Actinophytocola sp.]|nr:hypothetical protein [Actinophytocola sp.]